MRKLNYLLLTLVLVIFTGGLRAQDTITHLIISEIRCDHLGHMYFELTNMHETDSVDLGEFGWQVFRGANAFFVQDGQEVRLTAGGWGAFPQVPDNAMWFEKKKLGPKETYLIMNVQDGWNGSYRKHATPVHSLELAERADAWIHWPDWSTGDDRFEEYPYLPEVGCFGIDSTTVPVPYYSWGRLFIAYGLIWAPSDTISVMVDQALAEVDWDLGRINTASDGSALKSTAGIYGAHDDYTLVRKYIIKEGETNWTLSKGSDPASSSWILIPHNKEYGHMPFETEGNHGNFTLNYAAKAGSGYVFDDVSGTLTVPWGTEKFDSIRLGMDLGPGMAWEYIQSTNAEDSLSMTCKNGDKIILYACGNELQTKEFTIAVADPLASDKTVFAKRGITYPDPDADDYVEGSVAYIGMAGRVAWPVVDEYGSVMDTIGFLPYATPVDTLFMRLEKPANAEWEIEFKSGEESTEISEGDKLVLTAEDASTKEYYLQTEVYTESDEIGITSITWPDRPDQFMDGWGSDGFSDTIPDFSPGGLNYLITLLPGTNAIPALNVSTVDPNSRVEIDRATSLKGGVEERTTYIHVIAETDTTFSTIKVVFDVLNPNPQKYEGNPFFSKVYYRDWWAGGGFEIVNPTDYAIDMSKYMVVKSSGTLMTEGIEMFWAKDSTTWLKRYRRWVPSYKWGSWTEWQTDPGWLAPDGIVNSFIEPKDVMVVWRMNVSTDEFKTKRLFFKGEQSPVDVFMGSEYSVEPGVFDNPWNEPIKPDPDAVSMPLHRNQAGINKDILYLLKILNDSILLGTKRADDPEDFEVVDVVGSTVTPWNMDGKEMTRTSNWYIFRKPHIFFGDTILGQRNHLTNPDSSSWDVKDGVLTKKGGQQMRYWSQELLGSHGLDVITGHLSIIYSVVYDVSRGYSENETIEGVSKGENVGTFLGNIIKADESQMLRVTGGGVEKASDAAVAAGDILEVTSQSGNVTKYSISTTAIGGDVSLTALDTTVSVSEAAPFEVGGFSFGTSLEDILGSLGTADASVVVNVIDGNGELVPLTAVNTQGEYMEVAASSDYSLEVVAEDGTVRLYALVPATGASDAYIVSDVYEVEESPVRLVGEVPFGIGVDAFLANLVATEGAAVEILSATGQVRTVGRIGFGDQVRVTSGDASTVSIYLVQFEGSVLAYVTSAAYIVDAESSEISGIPAETDVATFMANVVPSAGSTMMLKDSAGVEKTEGTVLDNDVLYVESADGTNSMSYEIMVIPVSVRELESGMISVYPNPAKKVLYIENIPDGSYLTVKDITGRTMMMLNASDISGAITLSQLNNGVYILNVEKDGKKVATMRFIKK